MRGWISLRCGWWSRWRSCWRWRRCSTAAACGLRFLLAGAAAFVATARAGAAFVVLARAIVRLGCFGINGIGVGVRPRSGIAHQVGIVLGPDEVTVEDLLIADHGHGQHRQQNEQRDDRQFFAASEARFCGAFAFRHDRRIRRQRFAAAKINRETDQHSDAGSAESLNNQKTRLKLFYGTDGGPDRCIRWITLSASASSGESVPCAGVSV